MTVLLSIDFINIFDPVICFCVALLGGVYR